MGWRSTINVELLLSAAIEIFELTTAAIETDTHGLLRVVRGHTGQHQQQFSCSSEFKHKLVKDRERFLA